MSIRVSKNDAYVCGGCIISPLHVLTAAHSILTEVRTPFKYSVFAGQIDLATTNTTVYRNASKIIMHENFNRSTAANDIAIITVITPGNFFAKY